MNAISLSRAAPGITWGLAAVLGISAAAVGQVSTVVRVLGDKPVRYGDNSFDAKMPATGLGLGVSVYSNNFGNPSLPGMIEASGVQTLRYPGGSYADQYNWSLGTGNAGLYIAASSDFGSFVRILDASHTSAVVTINYGSNSTNKTGGQPLEAAAWVAYANCDPGKYGSADDVVLGKDPAGVNWYTAGYWAKLRTSTPEEYKSWASDAGVFDPAYSFLAIHHPAPVNIKYWEIGNEVGGNGYYGGQWEYDIHAPYKNGDTKNNEGRRGNPLLSTAAYAHNFIQFVRAMKLVDPTIKIGTGFAASRGDRGDETLLRIAGDFIDFGIIHWYPSGPNPNDAVATLPEAVTWGPSALSNEVENLRRVARTVAYKGPGNFDIFFTEFNLSLQNAPMNCYAQFTCDAYITGFENGVRNMDLQEMIGKTYVGDGPPTPGSEFYGIQMLRHFASTGDRFISTEYRDPKLRVHAIRKPDGSAALLIINDGSGPGNSQDRRITVNQIDVPKVGSRGKLFLFGAANVDGAKITPPTVQNLTGLGRSFIVTIPRQTIGVLLFSDVAPLPMMLVSLSTLISRRQRRGSYN